MPTPSGSSPSSLYGQEYPVIPYVSTASFKAFPTYIEVDTLNNGALGNAAAQVSELNNILLSASQWAIDFCSVPIHAHNKTESATMRLRPSGVLQFHPDHNPVQLVTAFSYAFQPTAAANWSSFTDLTGQFIEKGALVTLPFAYSGSTFAGLQFAPPSTTGELYTTYSYVAGVPNALLAANTLAGDQVLTVSDPTGITPGCTMRIWEPGVEEAVTVAASYGVGSTTVPLNNPMVNAHTSGVNIGAIPPSIRQAVTNYAIALLMRPDSGAEDVWPDIKVSTNTRADDARKDATGLVAEGYRLLRQYMRVR